jgi:hypothetical protein
MLLVQDMADRDRYITIRASDQEANMLQALAEADGVSGSDMLRSFIVRTYAERPGIHPKKGARKTTVSLNANVAVILAGLAGRLGRTPEEVIADGLRAVRRRKDRDDRRAAAPPMGIETFLVHCRTALAGSVLNGQRFLAQLVAPQSYGDLHLSMVELQSYLMFLNRAHRLFDRVMPTGVSDDLKAHGAEYVAKIPGAKILRDMAEHIDDYERGIGDRPEEWIKVLPALPLSVPGLKIDGEVKAVGPNSAISYIERGPQGTRVQCMIGNRLDPNLALDVARRALEIVDRDLKAVRYARHAKPWDPTLSPRQALRAAARIADARSAADRKAGAGTRLLTLQDHAAMALAELRASATGSGKSVTDSIAVIADLRDPVATQWARIFYLPDVQILTAMAQNRPAERVILIVARAYVLDAFALDCPELAQRAADATPGVPLVVVMSGGGSTLASVPFDPSIAPAILVEDARTAHIELES